MVGLRSEILRDRNSHSSLNQTIQQQRKSRKLVGDNDGRLSTSLISTGSVLELQKIVSCGLVIIGGVSAETNLKVINQLKCESMKVSPEDLDLQPADSSLMLVDAKDYDHSLVSSSCTFMVLFVVDSEFPSLPFLLHFVNSQSTEPDSPEKHAISEFLNLANSPRVFHFPSGTAKDSKGPSQSSILEMIQAVSLSDQLKGGGFL
jgi:hypothetical protein